MLTAVLMRVVFVVPFLVALLVSAAQTGPGLLRHLGWSAYDDFAEDILEGRMEVSDLAFLTPVLARSGPEPCSVLRDSPLLTLHFYAHDLRAEQAGANPFLPSDDPALSEQRASTRALLEQALACAPLDGNLWLELALLSRAMDDPTDLTARFLTLSKRYAPHENWVRTRHKQLFPDTD